MRSDAPWKGQIVELIESAKKRDWKQLAVKVQSAQTQLAANKWRAWGVLVGAYAAAWIVVGLVGSLHFASSSFLGWMLALPLIALASATGLAVTSSWRLAWRIVFAVALALMLQLHSIAQLVHLLIVLAVIGGLIAITVIAWLWGSTKLRKPTIKRGASSHYNRDGSAKRSYDTAQTAQVVAIRQGEQEGATLVAYKCSSCLSWHVGH